MPHPPAVELPGFERQGRFATPDRAERSEAATPLRGLTVLAVEDSRYASEALRLMCQRSGARLRRAETLAAAAAHLRLYRPDAVIVDLGLPDGRGEGLIRQLMMTALRPMVILGTSGSPDGRSRSMAAGADGYLEKPIESLAAFQRAVIGMSLAQEDTEFPALDTLALRDDLARAADCLAENPDASTRRYLGEFVQGLARMARDPGLAAAAEDCSAPGAGPMQLQRLIEARLAMAPSGFGN